MVFPSIGLEAVVVGEFAVDVAWVFDGLRKARTDNFTSNSKKAGPQASNAEFVGWHIISLLTADWPTAKEAP